MKTIKAIIIPQFINDPWNNSVSQGAFKEAISGILDKIILDIEKRLSEIKLHITKVTK